MITAYGVAVPEDMAAALAQDSEALELFEALRPGDQREFVDWVAAPGQPSRSERVAEIAGHVRSFQRREASSE